MDSDALISVVTQVLAPLLTAAVLYTANNTRRTAADLQALRVSADLRLTALAAAVEELKNTIDQIAPRSRL